MRDRYWKAIERSYRREDLVFKILFAIVGVLVAILVVITVILAFDAIDSAGITPNKTAVVVVEEKQIVPAHTTSGSMWVGRTAIPTMTHHPESYRLHFKLNGSHQELSVERKLFDSFKVGDEAEIDYGQARLTGKDEPVEIRHVRK